MSNNKMYELIIAVKDGKDKSFAKVFFGDSDKYTNYSICFQIVDCLEYYARDTNCVKIFDKSKSEIINSKFRYEILDQLKFEIAKINLSSDDLSKMVAIMEEIKNAPVNTSSEE